MDLLKSSRKLHFAAVTWNVNAKLPMQLHLEQLFATTLRTGGDNQTIMPDVLAVSVQEMVDLNPQNCFADKASRKNGEYWVLSLLKCLNRKDVGTHCHYNLLLARHCVGTFLTVLVQRRHIDYIDGICCGHLPIGKAGLGNKAGIAIGMKLYGVAMAIVGCHLPSGRGSKKLKARNQGFNYILENTVLRPTHELSTFEKQEETRLSKFIDTTNFRMDDDSDDDYEIPRPPIAPVASAPPRKGTRSLNYPDGGSDCISRLENYAVLFWMGDMNYRIEEGVSNSEAYRMIKHNLNDLLPMDQLTQARAAGDIKRFTEGKITFNPTYKYIPGTEDYDKRPDKKMRCPAWTDRVLWRNLLRPQQRVKQVYYNSRNMHLSDHMPVTAIFELELLQSESDVEALETKRKVSKKRSLNVVPAYPQLGSGFMTAWSFGQKIIHGWMMCSRSDKPWQRHYCAATLSSIYGYRSENMDVVQFQMPLDPATTLRKQDNTTLVISNPTKSLVDNVLYLRTTPDNSSVTCEDSDVGPGFTAGMQWYIVLSSLLKYQGRYRGKFQPNGTPEAASAAPTTSGSASRFAPKPFRPPPGGTLSGWMTKKPLSGNGSMKNRFFVLSHSDNMLRIYKDGSKRKCKALLLLTAETELSIKDECTFTLKPKSGKKDKRKLVATTSHADELEKWVRNIQAMITKLKRARSKARKIVTLKAQLRRVRPFRRVGLDIDLEKFLDSIAEQSKGDKMLTYLRIKTRVIEEFGEDYYENVKPKLQDWLAQRNVEGQASAESSTNTLTPTESPASQTIADPSLRPPPPPLPPYPPPGAITNPKAEHVQVPDEGVVEEDAPRRDRTPSGRQKMTMTEQKRGFKPQAHHVDVSDRFQGSVSKLIAAARSYTFTVPPGGVYIRSRSNSIAKGYDVYFYITPGRCLTNIPSRTTHQCPNCRVTFGTLEEVMQHASACLAAIQPVRRVTVPPVKKRSRFIRNNIRLRSPHSRARFSHSERKQKRHKRMAQEKTAKYGVQWQHEADQCSLCQKVFTALVRRHHCRFCGKCICKQCSNNKHRSSITKKLERICDECQVRVNNPAPPKMFGIDMGSMRSVGEGHTPYPMRRFLSWILFLRENGLRTVGIFRKPGEKSRVQAMRKICETSERVDENDFRIEVQRTSTQATVYNVSSLLKLFLREMKGGLISHSLCNSLQQNLRAETEKGEPLPPGQWLFCFSHLPRACMAIIKALFFFLHEVAMHSDVNKMTAANLAVCFAPSIFDDLKNLDSNKNHKGQDANQVMQMLQKFRELSETFNAIATLLIERAPEIFA